MPSATSFWSSSAHQDCLGQRHIVRTGSKPIFLVGMHVEERPKSSHDDPVSS